MSSIDGLSGDNDYDDGSIGTNDPRYICERSQIHQEINATYTIFKMRDCITQTYSEQKGSEL